MLQRLTNWWKRRRVSPNTAHEPPHNAATATAAAAAHALQQARDAMRDRPALNQTVRIEEINDPAIAAHLFRRKFGQEIPQFPRHFVALAGSACAGYVHYSAWQGDYLCGGLCIDDRVYRTFSPLQRAWLREHGGIAEIMLRGAHAALTDAATIWGYIGDKQAEVVDRRVGFEKVAEPYLFAIWRKPISEDGKKRRIAEAVKLGAF
jgi:hypothetical protein